MAVVERADREVVPEFGVPLPSPMSATIFANSAVSFLGSRPSTTTYGPMSDGVTGSAGGGGRLIKVGVVILGLGIAVLQAFGRISPGVSCTEADNTKRPTMSWPLARRAVVIFCSVVWLLFLPLEEVRAD